MSDLELFTRVAISILGITVFVSSFVFDYFHNNRPHDTFYDERDRDNKE